MDKFFFYHGKQLCFHCGNIARKELINRGEPPFNPDDFASYDSYDYPKGPYYTQQQERSNVPFYCQKCCVPLLNHLTQLGVKRVIDNMKYYVEGKLNDYVEGKLDDSLDNRLLVLADQIWKYILDAEDRFAITAFREVYRLRNNCEVPVTANGSDFKEEF